VRVSPDVEMTSSFDVARGRGVSSGLSPTQMRSGDAKLGADARPRAAPVMARETESASSGGTKARPAVASGGIGARNVGSAPQPAAARYSPTMLETESGAASATRQGGRDTPMQDKATATTTTAATADRSMSGRLNITYQPSTEWQEDWPVDQIPALVAHWRIRVKTWPEFAA